MKNFSLLMLTTFALTACGTGGGSSNVGSGHVTDGNNGNLAYYGGDITGNDVADADAPTDGVGVSQSFYFDVIDPNSRTMDFRIYHPTCITGSTTEKYSMILMTQDSTAVPAPTAVGVTLSANQAAYVYTSASVGASTNSFPAESGIGTTGTIATTCSTGRRTAPGWGQFYSNGVLAVLRTDEHQLYIGINSTLVSAAAYQTAVSYQEYAQNYYTNTCDLSGCSSKVSNATGGYTNVLSAMAFNTVSPYNANNATYHNTIGSGVLKDGSVSDTYSFKAINNSSAASLNTSFIGIEGIVGGKHVIVSAKPRTTAGGSIRGSDAVFLRLQN